jgi:hypothetical protein
VSIDNHRNPTPEELRVGAALTKWLQKHQATIKSQRQHGKNYWTTSWSTRYGVLIVTTKDNRVVAIASQLRHDSAEAMLDDLNHWSGNA